MGDGIDDGGDDGAQHQRLEHVDDGVAEVGHKAFAGLKAAQQRVGERLLDLDGDALPFLGGLFGRDGGGFAYLAFLQDLDQLFLGFDFPLRGLVADGAAGEFLQLVLQA